MAIKLNIAKSPDYVERSLREGYLYKDLRFDLNLNNTQGKELFRSNDDRDLESLYDGAAILNSIKNILTTSPGEKLLNPLFGLDLRHYLFEAVSETKAFFLGQDLLLGLTNQEPRVNVDAVDVVAAIDDMEYDITLDISVPTLDLYNLTLKGTLNNDGYVFV